jgi:hypothetical protein
MTGNVTWDLCSSGILRNVEWQFCSDVSGQPIGPIFKRQEVQVFLDFLTLEGFYGSLKSQMGNVCNTCKRFQNVLKMMLCQSESYREYSVTGSSQQPYPTSKEPASSHYYERIWTMWSLIMLLVIEDSNVSGCCAVPTGINSYRCFKRSQCLNLQGQEFHTDCFNFKTEALRTFEIPVIIYQST